MRGASFAGAKGIITTTLSSQKMKLKANLREKSTNEGPARLDSVHPAGSTVKKVGEQRKLA